ncbi:MULTISPECIES: HWE histidine kinase domain-containing protein [unclassified Brevundimonas]|uniref:HWE histidine kinase domain-containing protein n=1 Tax=unclassified Brevundimonas TaxID=2622653 RepID=UPI0025B7AC06|nr:MULTISPECIES: HWE histidine kinase domain-containing protein [unclassified Brevundimonas]
MTDSNETDVLIRDCLKTISLDGKLVQMDFDGLCLMEIDDFETFAGQSWSSLWPAESRDLVERSITLAKGGKVARFSADCPTAKGQMKSWEVCVTPIRNDAGEIVALQSISHDVSQREHDRRESALVSRELSHRMKNLFAVIDSLISLSARSQPEAQPFVVTLRERLNGLGRAITFINPMGSVDLDEAPRTVRGLIEALFAPYRDSGSDIVVSGDDVDLGTDAITSLSLVLNELTTNAVKYGAIKTEAGRLRIILRRDTDDLTIDWLETGGGTAPDAEPAQGFGTMLMNRTVRGQLNGSIEREWLADGLQARLVVPLARLG